MILWINITYNNMAFPVNTQELDNWLWKMSEQWASQDEMQVVLDGFRNNNIKKPEEKTEIEEYWVLTDNPIVKWAVAPFTAIKKSAVNLYEWEYSKAIDETRERWQEMQQSWIDLIKHWVSEWPKTQWQDRMSIDTEKIEDALPFWLRHLAKLIPENVKQKGREVWTWVASNLIWQWIETAAPIIWRVEEWAMAILKWIWETIFDFWNKDNQEDVKLLWKQILESDNVEAASKMIEDFTQANPLLAENVKNAVAASELTPVWLWAKTVTKSVVEWWYDAVSKIRWTFKKSIPDDVDLDNELIKSIWQEKVRWIVDWVEVDIPKQTEWFFSTLAKPWKVNDPKTLAWKALTPSYAWKWYKEILNTTKNIEKTTKQFYDNVRTWKIVWDIDTLENAAETVVRNIDIVWARIWWAIEKAKWRIAPTQWYLSMTENVLWNKLEVRSPAYSILRDFIEDTAEWLEIWDAFKAKKIYSDKIRELVVAKNTSSDSYKMLVQWVRNITNNIEDIIETQLKDSKYLEDKKLYWSLKAMVNDIVKSSAVEWRRSPNTFVEQLWALDAMFSPVQWLKNAFAKEVWKANTRWWAWEDLIKLYDKKAIDTKLPEVKTTPKTQPLDITPVKAKKTLSKNKIEWWIWVVKKEASKVLQTKKNILDFKQISNLIKDNPYWFTLDTVWKQITKQNATVVAPFPNRTKIIKSKDLNIKTVSEFFKENKDFIQKEWFGLWWWKEWDDFYLDVAVRIDNKFKNKALQLWKDTNQVWVFDLNVPPEKWFIGTSWNWKPMKMDENKVYKSFEKYIYK